MFHKPGDWLANLETMGNNVSHCDCWLVLKRLVNIIEWRLLFMNGWTTRLNDTTSQHELPQQGEVCKPGRVYADSMASAIRVVKHAAAQMDDTAACRQGGDH